MGVSKRCRLEKVTEKNCQSLRGCHLSPITKEQNKNKNKNKKKKQDM